ncbi:MAG: carbamoyl-phosphate synthase large subunit [Eubacteriales bacterium]
MPRKKDIRKVLVIGSGPIIIGQAAEFDYAGTQACRALREDGVQVVLINSNPATIMTDTAIADKVYIEPLNVEVIKNIISINKPDGLLATLGGQTGLNLAMELFESGFLEEQNVSLLGTNIESIKKAEDREEFKKLMQEIGEPVIDSVIISKVEEALDFAGKAGYPLVIRPAYTLGGTGGGIAYNEDELIEITRTGLDASRVTQVLLEKCVSGYKEIEYEVIRDAKGNCITVCNMENIDPVGIHTGDSIVVAPSQTLRDKEYQLLRSAAIKIINALKIEGGCNVQFALDTDSMKYYVIEVNPRVSRSSALASKATGYPIAKIATKIAIGYGLDEILNAVTGKTYACFEPTLDYVVVKFPRWPFDKFTTADKTLGTKMKATGEVMSIGSNFEAAFLKAVRSLELNFYSMEFPIAEKLSKDELIENIKKQDDERIFFIAQAIRLGISLEELFDITKIDMWYLNKFKNIIKLEEQAKKMSFKDLDKDTLLEYKKLGFSDFALAKWFKTSEDEIRALKKKKNIWPSYKMVDTCGAEFDAVSPYYYSTYEHENEAAKTKNKTVVVLGSGPIRIGQGVEFDYCSVHCVMELRKLGFDTVIINNNPETVSTDFDTSDRLYFEPLTSEEVLNVLEQENPFGVVVQFGGQTAIKLAKAVKDHGYSILGTSLENINAAEDRKEFDALLERLNIKRPKGKTVFTEDEAVAAAKELTYPVLVRPSYVLGGQGMEIAWDEKGIREYMRIISRVHQEHPILVDKYMLGKEVEIDAICDGEDILIPGIMEHIERAGVHSGDSISVYPPKTLSSKQQQRLKDITEQIALALNVKGLVNIQFIIYNNDIYIIEVNPRSSRTVPYLSKVTLVPMIELAVRSSLGESLKDMGYGTGIYPKRGITAVKVPVFSFEKLPDLEVTLGPEMKSTGEVLGISKDYSEALLKGLMAAGLSFPTVGGAVLLTVADNDKQELLPLAAIINYLGYDIYATPGTANLLNFNYIPANSVNKISEKSPNIKDLIKSGKIKFIINTPTKGRDAKRDGFRIRRMAVERRIPCFTSLDTARALLESMKLEKTEKDIVPISLDEIREIENG